MDGCGFRSSALHEEQDIQISQVNLEFKSSWQSQWKLHISFRILLVGMMCSSHPSQLFLKIKHNRNICVESLQIFGLFAVVFEVTVVTQETCQPLILPVRVYMYLITLHNFNTTVSLLYKLSWLFR